jgi:hypothetical protein
MQIKKQLLNLDQNLDYEKVIFGVQTIVYYVHGALFDSITSKKIVIFWLSWGLGKIRMFS